jgi:hypothetical protein
MIRLMVSDGRALRLLPAEAAAAAVALPAAKAASELAGGDARALRAKVGVAV